ncbi:MAG: 2-dehydropantoate 2-reductase N-terminal domain-containing protein, partial [Anaerovoracaceae bacterium]
MKQITVMGTGSFGTALAITLANKGHQVTMWGRSALQCKEIQTRGENKKYLPGIPLPREIRLTASLEEALKTAELVVFSVPAQQFRSVLEQSRPLLSSTQILVNVAKGIEQGSLCRLSQIAEACVPGIPYGVLSGPSHAEEVGRGLPTTVAVAAKDRAIAKK